MRDINAAHNERLRALDPMLDPVPPLDTDDPRFVCTTAGDGAAWAVLRFDELAAGDPGTIWRPRRHHVLDVRTAGPDTDRIAALELMLDRWIGDLTAEETPGDWDSSARVSFPSRDISVANTLYARGFAPTGINAVRPGPRTPAEPPRVLPHPIADGGIVRLAAESDIPALGALDARLLDLDSHFGGVTARPGAEQMLTTALAARIASAPETTWVLERSGTITGFLHVVPEHRPPESDTAPAPESAPAPAPGPAPGPAPKGDTAHLVAMYLDESERGAGTGAEFVSVAHRTLDAAGTARTMLSYAVANPRSGPFWSRMGYRPLVTDWQRRPARF